MLNIFAITSANASKEASASSTSAALDWIHRKLVRVRSLAGIPVDLRHLILPNEPFTKVFLCITSYTPLPDPMILCVFIVMFLKY